MFLPRTDTITIDAYRLFVLAAPRLRPMIPVGSWRDCGRTGYAGTFLIRLYYRLLA